MLFQIKGTNVKLLGTGHGYDGVGDYPPDWVKEAFNSTTEWVFECNTGIRGNESSKYLSLRQELNSLPFYDSLKALCLKLKVDQPILHIKPWAVQALLEMRLTKATFPGVDSIYQQRANAERIKTHFLETSAENEQAYDGIPWDEQTAMLKELVDNPFVDDSTDDDLHQSWKQGDLAKFIDEYAKDSSKYPGFYRSTIDGRNQLWLPKILSIVEGHPEGDITSKVLITVGVNHLCGEMSLIKLIEAEGYKLKKLV